MNAHNKKSANNMSYLCYAFAIAALIASLNVYFNFFDLQKEIDISNDFIAELILFLATSVSSGLMTLFSIPALKGKNIHLIAISMISCFPAISCILLAMGYMAWSHLVMILVCAVLFAANKIAFHLKYYPQENYHTLKIIIAICFVSSALIVQKTNAVSVLPG